MRKYYWYIRHKICNLYYKIIYKNNIPYYLKDSEYSCPCCGLEPDESDYWNDNYLGSYNHTSGWNGGEYWTEKWKCSRCGREFEFDTSN